jgi:hypothetical protein
MVFVFFATEELAPLQDADVDKVPINGYPKLVFIASESWTPIYPSATETGAIERKITQEVIAQDDDTPDALSSCHSNPPLR